MKKTIIAFDIDGTIRCNCEPTCRNANENIGALARILKTFKNTKLIAWSGGGKEYVESVIRDTGLDDVFSPARCFGKLEYVSKHGRPDIAIDDQQAFELGTVNLIVKEK